MCGLPATSIPHLPDSVLTKFTVAPVERRPSEIVAPCWACAWMMQRAKAQTVPAKGMAVFNGTNPLPRNSRPMSMVIYPFDLAFNLSEYWRVPKRVFRLETQHADGEASPPGGRPPTAPSPLFYLFPPSRMNFCPMRRDLSASSRGTNFSTRLLKTSTTYRLPAESTSIVWGSSKLPGPLPYMPQ